MILCIEFKLPEETSLQISEGNRFLLRAGRLFAAESVVLDVRAAGPDSVYYRASGA